MSGTQKSSLKNSQGKTQKNRVRIHSPGNQTREFKREFGKEDVNKLWTNGEDLRVARMSTEDKDQAKEPPLHRQRRKKLHIHSVKMNENNIFYNRKRVGKEAALKARQLLGITDVDSAVNNSTRNQKRVSRIVWPSDSIRSTVSASQMRHSPAANRSRKAEPVLKKTSSLSPDRRRKTPVEPLTLWERIFGK
jgi:hypothetical protein